MVDAFVIIGVLVSFWIGSGCLGSMLLLLFDSFQQNRIFVRDCGDALRIIATGPLGLIVGVLCIAALTCMNLSILMIRVIAAIVK